MSNQVMTDDQIADLSDDEILGMVSAPEAVYEAPVEPGSADAGDSPVVDDAGSDELNPDLSADDAADDDVPASEEASAGVPEDGEAAELDTAAPVAAHDATQAGEAKADPLKDGDKADTTPKDAAAPVDYKAVYDKIMAPFKAAGKTVQLTSPDDVIQLMQMGAHYTKKMQALQPNLKLLKMLENNNLLDESKLSFLLDVNRKDPAAIQKLVRESGLDPLEIDTSVEPEYRPGNHRVSDEEMRFTTMLEEVASDPVGKDMIVTVNKTWDPVSKEALWGDPSILKVLTVQKSNGIYDQISSEIERRKTLGYLRDETFLQSYESVGKEMQAKGAFAPKPGSDGSAQPNQDRRIVDTRTAAPKTIVNSDKARAASLTKATPQKKVAGDFNPLALSDEEFEKTTALAGRL